MSTLVTKGNWNIFKGMLKQRVARLLQDDMQFFEGKTDELVGRIQKRAGMVRQRIETTARQTKECDCGHR